MGSPRMTMPTLAVLLILLEDPSREMYGKEICAAAGLPSGTIHPILARLENADWLESRWEQVNPSERGRPRRRYYWLNPNNIATVKAAVSRADAAAQTVAWLRPRLAGGAS